MTSFIDLNSGRNWSVSVEELDTQHMILGFKADFGRAWNCSGQWRPFSSSVDHRLRPPLGTGRTDPDYLSRPNPQRLALPGHFPPKTHFSGQRIADTVPLNCENLQNNRDWGEKREPQSPPSSLIPHILPTVTLGKPKEGSLILGILLNILGLSVGPLSGSSLPPAKANSDWIVWPGSLWKPCHTRETIKYSKL